MIRYTETSMGRARGGRGGGRGRRGGGGRWRRGGGGGPIYVVPEYVPPQVVVVDEEGEPSADMDDENMGIGAPFEMRHGNLRIIHMGAAAKETIPGQAAHVEFMRAWKTHPPGFSAAELAGQLDAAAKYGRTLYGKLPIQLFPDFNKRPFMLAINQVEALRQKWQNRMGAWPWSATKYYAKTEPDVLAVYKAIVAMHEEAQGAKGGGDVVAEARQELKRDLTNPDRWAWWQKLKPWLIPAGILVGAAIAYPYVKPLLSRASRSE